MALNSQVKESRTELVKRTTAANKGAQINLIPLDSQVDLVNGEGDLNTPLHIACQEGNYDLVNHFLRLNNVDINSKRADGSTPLFCTIPFGHSDVLFLLLNHGCDVNSVNSQGDNPIHHVIMNCRYTDQNTQLLMLFVLLKKGCDINHQNNALDSPLHLAASRSNCLVAHYLLKNKADPNLLNREGLCPLHIAIYMKNVRMVQTLLLCPATNIHLDSEVGTPVNVALTMPDPDIHKLFNSTELSLKSILEKFQKEMTYGLDCFDKSIKKKTMLRHLAASSPPTELERKLLEAAKLGKTDKVKKLLKIGNIDPHIKLEDVQHSLLHVAAREGHITLVRYLLAKKILPVDVRDLNNMTPLLSSLKFSKVEVALLLISFDADISCVDNFGNTALHYAVKCKFDDHKQNLLLLNHLLNKGFINVNLSNLKGDTPLHRAAAASNLLVVQYLLSKKADPNIQNKESFSPVHLAIRQKKASSTLLLCGHPDVQWDLKSNEGTVQEMGLKSTDETIRQAFQSNMMNKLTIDFLTAMQKSLNNMVMDFEKDYHLGTLEFKTQEGGKTDSVKLCEAIVSGKLDVVKKMLKELGASNLLSSDLLQKSLLSAITSKNINITKAIIKAGADTNWTDANGVSILIIAFRTEEADICRLLINSGSNIRATDQEGNGPLHYVSSFSERPLSDEKRGTKKNGLRDSQNQVNHGPAELTNVQRKMLLLLHQLLHNGYDVNSTNKAGATPLHVAVSCENELIARYLLNNNANPNIKNGLTYTPLHEAIKKQSLKMVVLLLSSPLVDIDIMSREGLTCRAMGISSPEPRISAIFKAPAPQQQSQFISPVDSKKLIIEFERWVKKSPIETYRVGEADETSELIEAVKTGRLHVVKKLLKAMPDAPNENTSKLKSGSLLHIAAQEGHIAIVNHLIAITKNVDLDILDVSGMTPLLIAASRSHFALCTNLISSGASISVTSVSKDTALHYGIKNAPRVSKSDAVTGPKVPTVDSADRILLFEYLGFLQTVLQDGGPEAFNVPNSEGKYPIHLAVEARSDYSVYWLIRAGVNVNQPNLLHKTTPLHLALNADNSVITELLLANGAEIDSESREGKLTKRCSPRTLELLKSTVDSSPALNVYSICISEFEQWFNNQQPFDLQTKGKAKIMKKFAENTYETSFFYIYNKLQTFTPLEHLQNFYGTKIEPTGPLPDREKLLQFCLDKDILFVDEFQHEILAPSMTELIKSPKVMKHLKNGTSSFIRITETGLREEGFLVFSNLKCFEWRTSNDVLFIYPRHVSVILRGPKSNLLESFDKDENCLTLICPDGDFNFIVNSKTDFDLWYVGLIRVAGRMKEDYNLFPNFLRKWFACRRPNSKEVLKILQSLNLGLEPEFTGLETPTILSVGMPTAGDLSKSLKNKLMKHTKSETRSDILDDEASVLLDMLKKGNDDILIDFEEAFHFLETFEVHPEVVKLFRKHSDKGRLLTFKQFVEFMATEQQEHDHDRNLLLFTAFKGPENGLTLQRFVRFMNSEYNSIFDSKYKKVYQDMTRPLNQYFIESSHNTYLEGNQWNSFSTAEMYVRVLHTGCRCVELDCWDGDDGYPVIYHGHTRTPKVKFEDVVAAISKVAFSRSPYPLTLSLENHCSIPQQTIMARIFKQYFGDMIAEPLKDMTLEGLPSPEDLRYKILIKNKTITARGKSGTIDPILVTKVSPELSEIVFLKSVPYLPPSQTKGDINVWEMSAISEITLKKTSSDELVKHNTKQMTRVYPKGTRVDSSNYPPFWGWEMGCQMVALNYQTPSKPIYINEAFFMDNGKCGYTLKPKIMRDPNTTYDPVTYSQPARKSLVKKIIVKVMSLRRYPKELREYKDIEISIAGIANDHKSFKTPPKLDLSPTWDYQVEIPLALAEIAVLQFLLREKDSLVAYHAVPIKCMRNGFHLLPLREHRGSKRDPYCFLLVNIKKSSQQFLQNHEEHEKLCDATRLGKIDEVRKLLKKGANPSISSLLEEDNEQTPLHMAVALGHTQIVQAMLQVNVDINVRDKSDLTPLLTSLKCRNIEIAELLLKSQPDASTVNIQGNGALHYAMHIKDLSRRYLHLLNSLVDAGADLNLINLKQDTPLHEAVNQSNILALIFLLQRKADPTIPNKKSLTPLHLAVLLGNAPAVRAMILLNVDVTLPSSEGTVAHLGLTSPRAEVRELFANIKSTPRSSWTSEVELKRNVDEFELSLATSGAKFSEKICLQAKKGSLSHVRQLLRDGVSSSSTNLNLQTPLHLAAGDGHSDVVALLVKEKAKIDPVDSEGNTPLLLALMNGRHKMGLQLVGEGAKVTARNEKGFSALHYAVGCPGEELSARKRLQLIRLILTDENADIDCVTEELDTPLHMAVKSGEPLGLTYLLMANANPNIPNESGYTPLHLAIVKENVLMVLILRYFNQDPLLPSLNESYRRLIQNCNNQEIVHAFDAIIPDYKWEPVLALKQRVALFEEESGMPLARPRYKNPLHIAAQNGDLFQLESLLPEIKSQDALLRQPLPHQQTPLHLAAAAGHFLLVKKLLQLPCSSLILPLRDRNGLTPVNLAMKKTHYDIVRLFLRFDCGGVEEGSDNLLEAGIKNQSIRASSDSVVVEKNPLKPLECLVIADNAGNIPIHYAARCSCLTSNSDYMLLIHLLIARGSPVNVPNNDSETPLLVATHHSNHLGVFLLLKNGADPNVSNRHSHVPLFLAMSKEDTITVETLILHKAMPEMAANNDRIHELAAASSNPLLSRLLKKTSKPSPRKPTQPKIKEFEKLHSEFKEWLTNFQYPHLSKIDKKHYNIVTAIQHGQLSRAQRLLGSVPEIITLPDEKGRLILQLAVAHHQLPILLSIIGTSKQTSIRKVRGATDEIKPVNIYKALDSSEKTAIQLALKLGFIDLAHILFVAGGYTTTCFVAPSPSKNTLLHEASAMNLSFDGLDSEQSLNLKSRYIAMMKNIVLILSSRGKPAFSCPPKNGSPRLSAMPGKKRPQSNPMPPSTRTRSKSVFDSSGCSISTSGNLFVKIANKSTGSANIVANDPPILSSFGGDGFIDVVNEQKETPLHVAISNNNYLAVAFLLGNGADPNAENLKGQSPLHLALIKENVKIIDLLFCYGGRLRQGETFNQLVAKYSLPTIGTNRNVKKLFSGKLAPTGDAELFTIIENSHCSDLRLLPIYGAKML